MREGNTATGFDQLCIPLKPRWPGFLPSTLSIVSVHSCLLLFSRVWCAMIYIQAEMHSNILWHYPVHLSGCARPPSVASRGVNCCRHVSLQPFPAQRGLRISKDYLNILQSKRSFSVNSTSTCLLSLHLVLKRTFKLRIHICTTFTHHRNHIASREPIYSSCSASTITMAK